MIMIIIMEDFFSAISKSQQLLDISKLLFYSLFFSQLGFLHQISYASRQLSAKVCGHFMQRTEFTKTKILCRAFAILNNCLLVCFSWFLGPPWLTVKFGDEEAWSNRILENFRHQKFNSFKKMHVSKEEEEEFNNFKYK